MLKILVTGANGQLASEFKTLCSNQDLIFTSKEELDISDFEKTKDFIKENNIKIIINCAAYTAVDKAEEEKELALKINYEAVNNLAIISKEKNIKLIHISTDYVFDGENYKPYNENDKTNPINFYGESKLKGEQAIKKIAPKNSCIIRTSWVYSNYGKNFVKTILNLAKQKEELNIISDQVGTPTYAKDLAKAILEIIPNLNNQTPTIYHYSNEGVLSWYDFAKEIVKMAKLKCQINPIKTSGYPTPAKRPHFSLLDKSKIKEDFKINIPYWKDSLRDCITKIMSFEF